MKILQILPGFTVGGPTLSTTSLTRHIQRLGHQVQFHTALSDYSEYPDLDILPYHILHFPYNDQFALSTNLYKNLKAECRDAQIVQSNSLWQFSCFIHEYARRGTNAKSVIVPRGTLSPYALSLSSKKKKLILALGQRTALRKADMLIATCKQEYEDIRAFGLKQPVAILPNGLDLPLLEDVKKKKTVVFLGRIHKVKGVDLLIEAWRKIEGTGNFKDWNLVIAGPTSSDYAKEMQTLASDLKSVSFTGEVKGAHKNTLLAQSAIYVLPTHTENFGISIGEALACATPVVTTTGAPWSGLVDNDCGLWIDLSVDNLTCALEDMMSRPMEELTRMGQNGREWMKRDFSWDEIATKTIRSYEWLLDPANVEKPRWIITD